MRGDGKTKTENVLSSKNFHMWDHKTTHLSRVSIEHCPASGLKGIRSIPEMRVTAKNSG